ncbi:MAG: hypothetical protein PHS77_00675 [Gallionellaceae bacterium]|nr:hypothetical protein [Gallionellaceae bacterium]
MRTTSTWQSSARPAWAGLLAAGLLLAGQAWAAVTMQFVFVAPSATIEAAFPGATHFEGLATGYKGVEITAANRATFRAQAPANMLRTYDVLQSGQALRRRVDQVTQINGGKTDEIYLLVDDRTGLTNNGIFSTSSIGGKTAVWPAASVAPATGDRYRGVIRLGELASGQIQGRPGGWLAWEGTILHETFHTQFVGEKTKWGSISIVYGGDGDHYVSELMAEQELPLEEGLGTFFGQMHNTPAGWEDLNRFWSRNDVRYLIESRSFLAGTAEMWNAPHTEERRSLSELPPEQRTGSYVWRRYRWWDVPGWYLLFSESTSTGFHMYFWRQVNDNQDEALAMINTALGGLWQERRKRYLTNEINRLALEMERFAGTAEGRAAQSAGRLTSSMFPFALLDILTHYGMTEQQYRQDYDRNYPDRQPRAYAEYWNHRQAVRSLVEPMLRGSPIRMRDAVVAAAQYFQRPNTILAATP